MNQSGDALGATLRALGKALVLLAVALLIFASGLLALLAALSVVIFLLAAYTLGGLAFYVRQATDGRGDHAPTDEALASTTFGPYRGALRTAGMAIAAALCVLTSLAGLWMVIGWIGQAGGGVEGADVTLPRLVYGLSCFLPALLLMARRPAFGSLFLGGLSALALVAVLNFAPALLVPILFAAVQSASLLLAYRHLSPSSPHSAGDSP